MRTVLAERRPDRQVAKTQVGEPTSEPLEGDVVVMDVAQRKVVAVQQVLPASASLDRLRSGLTGLMRWENPITAAGMVAGPKGHAGGRASGIYAPHRTFGWVPPQVLRQRYGAMPARFDREEHVMAAILHRLGVDAWDVTQAAMPTAARLHAEVAQAVPACWWLAGAPWTSGIINANNALPYHRDGGNITGTLSAMLSLRRGVEGGALHLADYDVWLGVPDRSIITFSGQSVLHGVSPLRIRRGGRRFTMVWYTRHAMTKCAGSWEGEVARAQLYAATHDHVPDPSEYREGAPDEAAPAGWLKTDLRGRGGGGEVVRVRGL